MKINELSQKTFTVPNLSKNWLLKNYFRYSPSLSNSDDGDIYTLRFPVMSWNVYVTVEAEIMINAKENLVHINCYDKGTRSLYAAWYSYYYGDYTEVVDKINDVIYQKIKKLQLKEVVDNQRTELYTIPRRKNEKNSKVQ